jgi:hypothetical protein
MKTNQQNDQELWCAFHAGDRAAFPPLFDLYYRQLYSYSKQVLDDESLTEDAIQYLL